MPKNHFPANGRSLPSAARFASILGGTLSIAVDLVAGLGVLAFVGALCLACGG